MDVNTGSRLDIVNYTSKVEVWSRDIGSNTQRDIPTDTLYTTRYFFTTIIGTVVDGYRKPVPNRQMLLATYTRDNVIDPAVKHVFYTDDSGNFSIDARLETPSNIEIYGDRLMGDLVWWTEFKVPTNLPIGVLDAGEVIVYQ